MLLDVIKAIESTGAKVRVVRPPRPSDGDRPSVTLKLDNRVVEFLVDEHRHSPYLTDVAKLAQMIGTRKKKKRPFLVAPYVSPALGDALVDAGWSWADAAGNFDLKAPGLRLRQRLAKENPIPRRRELPGGVGTTAILRWLLSKAPLGERIDPSVLGEVGQVSQPRVSQLMQILAQQGLLNHVGRAYKLETVGPLLDAFLRDYRGPGGSERYVYSLDQPDPFAVKVVNVLHRQCGKNGFGFSADVGPDLICPWRKPSVAVIYLRQSVSLDELDVVAAHGFHDANVILRMPDDLSVFSTMTTVQFGSAAIPLVDPPQLMWDQIDLRGGDREEAAGHLREWFIKNRQAAGV